MCLIALEMVELFKMDAADNHLELKNDLEMEEEPR